MKKIIIIVSAVFISLISIFILIVYLFGNTTVRKENKAVNKLKFEDSPFYKNILQKNDSIIYLNVWASYSPDSILRAEELSKDSNKIVYNLSIDKDTILIKNCISKYNIKNDISIDNYEYIKVIFENVLPKLNFFGETIEITNMKTPYTVVFEKTKIVKDY